MNIEQEKMVVESLPSLYPLKSYEEDAIRIVLDALPHWIPVDLENNKPQLEEWVLVSSDGYVMQDCIALISIQLTPFTRGASRLLGCHFQRPIMRR